MITFDDFSIHDKHHMHMIIGRVQCKGIKHLVGIHFDPHSVPIQVLIDLIVHDAFLLLRFCFFFGLLLVHFLKSLMKIVEHCKVSVLLYFLYKFQVSIAIITYTAILK